MGFGQDFTLVYQSSEVAGFIRSGKLLFWKSISNLCCARIATATVILRLQYL